MTQKYIKKTFTKQIEFKKRINLNGKGLANNMILPIKPEKRLRSRTDDFIYQLLPFTGYSVYLVYA